MIYSGYLSTELRLKKVPQAPKKKGTKAGKSQQAKPAKGAKRK